MALSWISTLKTVPWSKLILAAPTLVQTADTLWSSLRRRPAPAGAKPDAEDGDRIAILERELAELREELLSSSEVIRSLAGQNARLVKAVDGLRLRQWLLLAATVGLGIVCVAVAG